MCYSNLCSQSTCEIRGTTKIPTKIKARVDPIFKKHRNKDETELDVKRCWETTRGLKTFCAALSFHSFLPPFPCACQTFSFSVFFCSARLETCWPVQLWPATNKSLHHIRRRYQWNFVTQFLIKHDHLCANSSTVQQYSEKLVVAQIAKNTNIITLFITVRYLSLSCISWLLSASVSCFCNTFSILSYHVLHFNRRAYKVETPSHALCFVEVSAWHEFRRFSTTVTMPLPVLLMLHSELFSFYRMCRIVRDESVYKAFSNELCFALWFRTRL